MMFTRNGGFTSIDLAITLGIVGLVLALGVQRVNSSVWQLDSAGQLVVQRVRAARTLAALRQHDVIVTFDIGARTIVTHEDANNDGVVDDAERVTRQGLEGKIQFTRGAAPAFAGFADGAVSFDDNSLTFKRNGSASEEGAVYISRPAMEKARVIVISRATGYAEMHRYNGSNWRSD